MSAHGAHDHGSSGTSADWIIAAPFAIAAVAYLGAATEGRRPWPWFRSVFWIAGLTAAAAGFVGPLAASAHESFTAHMATHLLVGMVAPLLLVLAAPVTLALRSLRVTPARRLSRVLRSPVARVLTHPVVAALLNVGGLWVLYRTPLYAAMQHDPLVHLAVMAHVLVAGWLYTVALVPADPAPHRSGFALRAVVLVLSLAAHGILAKLLYAYPPPGVSVADAQAGAQLMFYGGDLVEFVLIVLLCAEWYRATGRRLPTPTATAPIGAAP